MITGETIIKGLLFYILKSRAAVGEIHHWASGDYKKDVHGWKKIKKDIQKHMEDEYLEHQKKHGDTDYLIRNTRAKKQALSQRLELLESQKKQFPEKAEKYDDAIANVKKYLKNIPETPRIGNRMVTPKGIEPYKLELKEKLLSMYKYHIAEQVTKIYSSKIDKLKAKIAKENTEIEKLKIKITENNSKIESLQEEFETNEKEYDRLADIDFDQNLPELTNEEVKKMDSLLKRNEEIEEEINDIENEMLDEDIETHQDNIATIESDIDDLETERDDKIEEKVDEYKSQIQDDLEELEGEANESALAQYEKTQEFKIRESVNDKYRFGDKFRDYTSKPGTIKELDIARAKSDKKRNELIKKILSRLNRGKK